MLAKRPTRRKTTYAKKRTADHHHRKSRNYIKSYWPYLPMVAIVTAGILLNSWFGNAQGAVLSFATNTSSSGLLSGTNAERNANGLSSLSINSTLSLAAQNKAADMSANDYWAHNSPSGKTPWSFITAAGYRYQTAGENLAYGFLSSSETIAGWMASPGHRANILNSSYTEVGFGILNIENYQGDGQQTLVVAMYGSPVAPTPPPAPTPTPTPAPTPVAVKAVPPVQSTPAPKVTKQASNLNPEPVAEPTPTKTVEQPADKKADVAVDKKQDTATPVTSTTKDSKPSTTEPESKQIARVQVINSANVAWSQFALSMLVSVALLVFLLRHSFAWHKVLARGERFILRHPLLDIAIVAIATMGTFLLQTSGFIR